MWLPRG